MKGALLASGGVDSTVLMYWMAKKKNLDSVFFADYGQASAKHQLELVLTHARILSVPVLHERINWPEHARGKGHIFTEGSYPASMVSDPYAPARYNQVETDKYLEEEWDFLQGRNIVFLGLAGAWAIHRGLRAIYAAFQFDQPEWNAMDEKGAYGGVDTSPDFVNAFNSLAESGAFSKPLTLEAPFLETRMTKVDIVSLGVSLGVPLYKTHSCEFFPPCGGCHQCLIRKDVLGKELRYV